MKNTSFLQGDQFLPHHVEEIIGAVPRAGTGVHKWLFVTSLKLQGRFSPDDIVKFLRTAVVNCERHVPDTEIVSAVRNATRSTELEERPPGSFTSKPSWPEIDLRAVQEVIDSIPEPMKRLSDMTNWGGIWGPQDVYSTALIGMLFPGDPLICAGHSVQSMFCDRRSQWGTFISTTELIVPSPMTAIEGINKEGRISKRCLANTGARRFLVIEFDNLSIEGQAAIHIHLSSRYPLALVVHSGGKSLHGWYFVAGRPEEELKGFMRYAVSLGADSSTWGRCQAVRTPGGLRRGGRELLVQYPVFCNPNYAA